MWSPCVCRNRRTTCSAAYSSPSTNRLVAKTTSGGRFADGAVAMTDLLVQAAVIGMHGREPDQRPEGVRNAPEIALADCDEVQHVAVLGHLGEQRLCQRKCLGELTLLRERPRSPD